MTKEESALYECNIYGFLKYFKESNFKNPKEAIDGSIKYILRHNIDKELTNCQLNELIYVAKNEVAKFVAKEQLKNNMTDLTNMHSGKDNKEVQYFFADTINYLVKRINNGKDFEIIPSKKNPEEMSYARRYNSNIQSISNFFSLPGAKLLYDRFDKNMNNLKAYDGILHLESKLPDHSIEDSFDRQKPSFFEKLFRTTSEEYENFKTAFNNYNNKKHKLYGNDKALEDAAVGYLHHKFPNLKENELPTPEQISRLKGAGKDRADFCLKVVEVCRENKNIKDQAIKMESAIKTLDIDELKSYDHNKKDLIEDSFQSDLKDNLMDEEVDVSADNINNIDVLVDNEIRNQKIA